MCCEITSKSDSQSFILSLKVRQKFPGMLACVPAAWWSTTSSGFFSLSFLRIPNKNPLAVRSSLKCFCMWYWAVCVLSFAAAECHPAVWCQPRRLPPLVAASHCQTVWCPWCTPAGPQVSTAHYKTWNYTLYSPIIPERWAGVTALLEILIACIFTLWYRRILTDSFFSHILLAVLKSLSECEVHCTSQCTHCACANVQRSWLFSVCFSSVSSELPWRHWTVWQNPWTSLTTRHVSSTRLLGHLTARLSCAPPLWTLCPRLCSSWARR